MDVVRNRERVARNFIRRYGSERFSRLLEALAEGTSGQVLADEFEVSRERVRQWKNTFGQLLTLYQVYPEVRRILDVPPAPGSEEDDDVDFEM
jgi:hypothetical protein